MKCSAICAGEINGSIIIISHQERILDIADEIIVLADGKISARGTKEQILPQLLDENCQYCPKGRGPLFEQGEIVMNDITKKLLSMISDISGEIKGAFNIREDSGCAGRQSSENVDIVPKVGQPGIDIIIKPNTKETVYIPACVTKSNVNDLVYNDFYVGENSDIVIVAGCGVHVDGEEDSQHNGIHRFFLSKNARVRYEEKHIGIGDGTGKRIINPKTHIEMAESSYMEMDTVQIKGVDSTKRETTAVLQGDAQADYPRKDYDPWGAACRNLLQGGFGRGRFQCRFGLPLGCKGQFLPVFPLHHQRKQPLCRSLGM